MLHRAQTLRVSFQEVIEREIGSHSVDLRMDLSIGFDCVFDLVATTVLGLLYV